MGIRYNSIESIVKVRLEIGICNGNQNICGPSMHYATNFKETKESVSANANWGVVSAIGRRFGKLYFQVQDETGKVIREDKMEISTLLAVEQEMSRLMSAVEAKSVDFQNQCRH